MPMIEINPDNIKEAEVVVAIPSYNEADSIGFPITQADKGLTKYFANKSSVIINCDNDSPDGTKQVFLDTPTKTPKIYISTDPGVKGKGNNFRNLFQIFTHAWQNNSRCTLCVTLGTITRFKRTATFVSNQAFIAATIWI